MKSKIVVLKQFHEIPQLYAAKAYGFSLEAIIQKQPFRLLLFKMFYDIRISFK